MTDNSLSYIPYIEWEPEKIEMDIQLSYVPYYLEPISEINIVKRNETFHLIGETSMNIRGLRDITGWSRKMSAILKGSLIKNKIKCLCDHAKVLIEDAFLGETNVTGYNLHGQVDMKSIKYRFSYKKPHLNAIWVLNCDIDFLLKTVLYSRTRTELIKLEYAHNEIESILSHNYQSSSMFTSYYKGRTLCFVQNDDMKIRQYKPAALLYEGHTFTLNRINKLVNVSSFLLGKELIFLGCSQLDENKQPISIYLKTPNKIPKTFYSPTPNYPIEYGTLPHGFFTQGSFCLYNNLLNSLMKIYNKYNLDDFFFFYWYGEQSVIGFDLVIYSAAIENLVNICYGGNKIFKVSNTEYVEIMKTIKSSLRSELDQDIYNYFINKYSYCNTLSIHESIKKLLKDLNINFANLEEESLRLRHKGAHGQIPTKSDLYPKYLCARNVLKTLCNKLILRLAGYNGYVYDYSNPQHPLIHISKPLTGSLL